MIVWQDGNWEVRCDPEDGGRIGSIRWQGRELLTRPHLVGGRFQAPAGDYGDYETRPVFGYDDCWPCLEACRWPGTGRKVRDHGELVWLEWEALADSGVMVARVSDTSAGWQFERRTLNHDGALVFEYACANTGSAPFPMSWAGHVLVPPSSVTELSLPGFGFLHQGSAHGGACLQMPDDVWSYLASLPTGEAAFLVLGDLTTHCVQLQFDDLNWRWSVEGISRPAIGLWYNRSGYPGSGELAREEFGIEWMTSPVCALDSFPQASDAVVVEPGAEHSWRMRWEIAHRSDIQPRPESARPILEDKNE